MVKMTVAYTGNLICELTHNESGAKFLTEAPKDNAGKGEHFSPTDLVGAALGSCALTVMAIYGEKHGINLKGMRAEVLKEMATDPVRRVGSIEVKITMPQGISVAQRATLERVAHICPVHKTLDPAVKAPITFVYPD